jgi:hypothetical protein
MIANFYEFSGRFSGHEKVYETYPAIFNFEANRKKLRGCLGYRWMTVLQVKSCMALMAGMRGDPLAKACLSVCKVRMLGTKLQSLRNICTSYEEV